jgi:hypothetical protein
MACGTPVIGTDVGGIGELVRNGESGWLLASSDDASLEQELTATLSAILRDPALAKSYRTRARAVAEQHVSFAAVAARLRASFRSPAMIGDSIAPLLLVAAASIYQTPRASGGPVATCLPTNERPSIG